MNVLLMESPMVNLEGPGLPLAWSAGCLRVAAHNVTQWNAGAAMTDYLISAEHLRQAESAAREAVKRLSHAGSLNRIQGAGMQSLLDTLPLAGVLIDYIEQFKAGLRRGGPAAPLSSVPFDPVQAAFDLCTVPFFPERIVFPERHRYNNPSYLSPWSPRCLADLLAAAAATDTFWDEPIRRVAVPYAESRTPGLIVLFANGPNQIVPAFKMAVHLRAALPACFLALAGNWPMTAMRDIDDARLFDIFHFIVTGPPEDTLTDLCLQLNMGSSTAHVPGIRFRNEAGQIVSNPAPSASRFSERPAPDYRGYNFEHLFSDPARLEMPYQLSIGCAAGNCAFCMSDTPRMGEYAAMPARTAVQHLRAIAKATRTGAFRFSDPSLEASQAARFSKALLDDGFVITWHATVRPDPAFSYDVCELMRAAGCISLDVGLEILDDFALSRLGKGLKVSQMEAALTCMAANGITVNAHMLYGLPFVDSATFARSMDTLLDWIRSGLVHNVRWNTFLLLKHSPMATSPEMHDMKLRPAARLDASEMLLFERTGTGMTDKELAELWQDANARTAQTLSRARMRPVRPDRNTLMPSHGDARFLSLRPMILPYVKFQESVYPYQALRNCSPVQWNPAELSFSAFEAAAEAGNKVQRSGKTRTLAKNPLANTQFELSEDYTRILDEIRKGGPAGDIIARIESAGPVIGEPNEFADIFNRLLQLRGYLVVFTEE